MDAPAPTPSSELASLPLSALQGELETQGEAPFRRAHPHAYLLVLFAPPSFDEPARAGTRQSRIPELALPSMRPDIRRVIELRPGPQSQGRVRVGRTPDNELVIPSTWISKRHAAFVPHRAGLALEDLGSVNGTLLNGAKLVAHRAYRLETGDKIALWRYVFEYLDPDALILMLREPTRPRG
ncbi:MAG TPA: FHA domain-containing protein [Myxococcota bacterium]|nr:FHA domain-containing protein [Myxococcota bacterium]HRY94635.1 FHA domain-containing protein [Myxococcota bacterium]HSA21661.1 FHA domain-containing protein [Myxococcota bacterium]